MVRQINPLIGRLFHISASLQDRQFVTLYSAGPKYACVPAVTQGSWKEFPSRHLRNKTDSIAQEIRFAIHERPAWTGSWPDPARKDL